MGRADMHFAACAIAVALLAGAGGAVAAADTGDSAGSESTNNSEAASGTDQFADHTDATTYAGGANANPATLPKTRPAARKAANRSLSMTIPAPTTVPAAGPLTGRRRCFPKLRLPSTSPPSPKRCPRLP
jgi:hypothetical protein